MTEVTTVKIKDPRDGSKTTLHKLSKAVESQSFLQLVNAMLAKQRTKAFPYELLLRRNYDRFCERIAAERGGEDPEPKHPFLGACLLQTADNRFFLTSNIHTDPSPATNRCAEANALLEACNAIGVDKTEVKNLWFMGGRAANRTNRGSIMQEDALSRACPCGSCRQQLADFSYRNPVTGEGAKIHILPLNDGKTKLERYNPKKPDQANRALCYTVDELLPMQHITQQDAGEDVEQWYEWLTRQGKPNDRRETSLIALQTLEGNRKKPLADSYAAIHEHLQEAFKAEYQRGEKKGKTPRIIEVSIARDASGHYHLGRFSVGVYPSMAPAEANAIQNTKNKNITDLFILRADLKEIATQQQQGRADFELDMPGGHMRQLALKAGAKGNQPSPFDRASQGDQSISAKPRIHVFALTTRKRFDPDRHIYHFTIDELLPHAFIGPNSRETRLDSAPTPRR